MISLKVSRVTGVNVETHDKSRQQASWITKLSSLFSIEFVLQKRWLEMNCKMILMNLISSLISFAHDFRNSQRSNFLSRSFFTLYYRHFNTHISIASTTSLSTKTFVNINLSQTISHTRQNLLSTYARMLSTVAFKRQTPPHSRQNFRSSPNDAKLQFALFAVERWALRIFHFSFLQIFSEIFFELTRVIEARMTTVSEFWSFILSFWCCSLEITYFLVFIILSFCHGKSAEINNLQSSY